MGTETVMTRTPLAVRGTGSALPGAPLSTPELLRRTARHLPEGAPALALRIAKRLGIVNRHMVRSFLEPQETPRAEDSAPKLASRALSAALSAAHCDVNGVRMLIGHTTTPHTLLPGNIAWVAEELAYRGAHIELRQACSGFAAATLLGGELGRNRHRRRGHRWQRDGIRIPRSTSYRRGQISTHQSGTDG